MDAKGPVDGHSSPSEEGAKTTLATNLSNLVCSIIDAKPGHS
jgi:hypothetical protein